MVEEKGLTGIEQVAGRPPLLTWSPPVRDANGGQEMRRWTRKFRLFGHDAPSSYLAYVPSTQTWEPRSIAYGAPKEPAVYLDTIVEGLEPGVTVLLATGAKAGADARVLQVTGVGPAGAVIGATGVPPARPALETTVTRLSDPPIGLTAVANVTTNGVLLDPQGADAANVTGIAR